MQTIVILHNIRSVQNVGSIFRTADGAGVSKIILTGYTPTPIDRFGRARSDFTKASLGAEQSIPWSHNESIVEVINVCKQEGYEIVAVEQDNKAIDYRTYVQTRKTAFIFGNEVEGVPQDVLECCEKILEIPMAGEKESLNVSVAAGVVLYGIQKI